MKNNFLFLLCFMFLGMTLTQASFPVNKEKAVEAVKVASEKQMVEQAKEVQFDANFEVEASEAISPAVVADYNKWVALAFLVFLGFAAAHRWYAGKPTGWNILFILTLGGLGIWAIVDLINILMDNF